MKPDLPIDSHLPRICDELSQNGRLVLIAEPGAGKTTRVPPAILDRVDSDGGQVLLLQPRRVAALSAATRIATERDGDVGGEVGYQVRFERRLSSSTRVRVVTTGILLRELQRDPFLSDVACVIFDEFHERSLESDLCLSLVDEVRRDARPELSVLVMSATLDAKPISKFLDDAPVVEVEGRPYPLEISYRPRALRDPIELHVRAALEETWSERKGNALVFLPGIGAIRNCERELGGFAAKTGAEICCLYGSQSLDEQARILRPSPTSRRVILSTNVAETSLTIECVDLVVDSGLVRELISDPRVGVDRLETNRVSQHSAEQRAGRAGRLGPGRVVRLWSAAEQATLAEQTTPEVRRVDLAAAVLQLKAWGLAKPQDFRWFEPPSGESIERAVRLLEQLGATEAGDGAIGEIGHALLRFGCHPRIARVLYEACHNGFPEDGARIAALLDERDFLSWIGEDRDASGLRPDSTSPPPSRTSRRHNTSDGIGLSPLASRSSPIQERKSRSSSSAAIL
ncbi:MAG: DEAD/DEAH box helicase, partial [Planctomycetota bacterium]